MNYKIFFVLLIIFSLTTSCSSQKQISKNKEKPNFNKDNTTSIVETSGGIIRIPGLWEPFHYDETSRQHFLRNPKGVIIGIAQNLQKAYPFFKKGMSGYNFIKTYTNWDIDYQNENGNNAKIIRSNIEDEYQIWTFKDKEEIVNVFLYGINGNYVLNLLVYTNDWEENKTIDFLKETYNLNKK
ncbi:MAG: hypothetical protein ACE364_08150 [Chlorobiota bacterium]